MVKCQGFSIISWIWGGDKGSQFRAMGPTGWGARAAARLTANDTRMLGHAECRQQDVNSHSSGAAIFGLPATKSREEPENRQ